MGIHNNSLIGGSGQQGYQISRSVRLRSSATAYFNRTPAVAGNRRTWTWSGWVKRGVLGTTQILLNSYSTDENNTTEVGFNSSNQLFFSNVISSTQNNGFYGVTTAVFRDPSAWYHLIFAVDTTQSTVAAALKLYVNGVQQTITGSYGGGTNQNTWVNAALPHRIGQTAPPNSSYFDGYLTEINFIDGQALTPSSFGETNVLTGVWQPKKYTGTYGTNGFDLDFSDNSAATAAAIGKDLSGNGNNWTPNNISVTAGVTYDSMLDTPTPYADGGNGRGNYCTLNPLYKGTSVTSTEGNLKFAMASGNLHEGITGTIFPTSGKWYAEFRWNAVTAATTATAVCRNNAAMNTITCAFQTTVDANSPTYRSYIVNGNKDTNSASAAYGNTYTANDIIGVALDLDNNKVWFSKNGTWQASGDPAAGTNAAFTDITGSDGWTFGVSGYGSGGDNCNANFGQRPFTYTPPTGFVALNTQNLPIPTITNGANYMAATLYTGTGATQSIVNTVNGVSLQPDLVWIKSRSNVLSHKLTNSVVGIQLALSSDSNAAESSDTGGVTAFNSNGFTIGTTLAYNTNAATYVAWQWNAGGSTVTNTSGTISSQVRANPTAGFSIVTYTGTGSLSTVGHGLGVAPRMIIIKKRSTTGNWSVYHANLTSVNHSVYLNSTNTQASDVNTRGSAPSSTTFSVGTDLDVNASGTTLVAYCFSEVSGYSKFGVYTGNGSTDGAFVFLGFRPKFVMLKGTATGGSGWQMQDSSRNIYNVANSVLRADLTAAESTGYGGVMDFLSNGFKLRVTDTNYNSTSYGPYIYMAFAENPFKNSLAR
jgi:hypothetical protein